MRSGGKIDLKKLQTIKTVNMEGTKLLEDYPKAGQVVKQWFLEKMLEGLKDENLPEDFKKHVREQDLGNEQVGKLIDLSPRGLFDVFDSHKIYIETLHEITGFWWKIKDDKTFLRLGNDPFKNRKDADKEAIVESFKLLEEKL
jgi:hypothetical protein